RARCLRCGRRLLSGRDGAASVLSAGDTRAGEQDSRQARASGTARSGKPATTEKNMIRMVLAVVTGGVVGTLIRFGVATWVSAHWPWHFYVATLAVNLLGCLLIGYLYAFFLAR